MSRIQRLRPLQPVFDAEKLTGSIQVGNSPSYPIPDPRPDFIWHTTGGPEPSPVVNETVVSAGQVLVYGSVYRDIGAAGAGTPVFSGTATLGSSSTIYPSAAFDTAGVSRGSAALYTCPVLTDGTLIITAASLPAEHVGWAMVLPPGSSIFQQARSTANETAAVSLSLSSAPSHPVYCICQYGGTAGVGHQWPGPAPAGWELFASFGSAASYGKHVFLMRGTAQSIAFNLNSDNVAGGGRDVVLLEIG